jgi:phospholipid/cholesterol/gamma-HCH transport system substrate-binding protein
MMEEKDPRFRNIQRKTGLFIFVAVGFIGLTIVLLGLQQDVFTPKESVYFSALSGTGLNVGQAVKYKGFRIGKVKNVSLTDQGQVNVKLSVLRDYMHFIRTDSVAELSQEGVIGEFIIEITPGTPAMPEVTDGDTINFRKTISMGDIAQELKGQLEAVITQVTKITTNITDPEGDVQYSLHNIRKLTEGLVETRGRVDRLVGRIGRDAESAVGHLNSTMARVDGEVMPSVMGVINGVDRTVERVGGTVGRVDGILGQIDERVPGMMNTVEASLGNVRGITEDVRGATAQVPGLAVQGRLLAEDATELTTAAKNVWPLNKYIKPPGHLLLEVDGYE